LRPSKHLLGGSGGVGSSRWTRIVRADVLDEVDKEASSVDRDFCVLLNKVVRRFDDPINSNKGVRILEGQNRKAAANATTTLIRMAKCRIK